jgi:hypothetical protein
MIVGRRSSDYNAAEMAGGAPAIDRRAQHQVLGIHGSGIAIPLETA